MKRNIIAVILVFALLMSFASCRKLEDSDAFVVESKVYVVDANGEEQKVQTAVNEEGVTEFYYYDGLGNKVTIDEKDVVVATQRVPKSTEMFADLTPEEQSFLDQFNNPEAFDELIDTNVVVPEMSISESILPEDAFDEIDVELDEDGKPVHDDIKATYEELVEGNKFTMDLTMKNISNGTETIVDMKTSRDGDKVFFETTMPVEGQKGGMVFDVIIRDGKCYFVIPSMRAYMLVPGETMAEFMPGEIITEDVNSKLEYVSSAEVQYEGQTFICDVFEGDGSTVKYYYQDGELKRIENIMDENNMTIMEIHTVSKEVDNSRFNLPKNYMDMSRFFENGFDISGLAG